MRQACLVLAWVGVALAASRPVGAQQVADPDFSTKVANPAYRQDGPRVVVDEAHRNFHTTSGRYKPLADLLAADGYRVAAGTAPFTRESLASADILVIANAAGEPRDSPAFTEAECDAVRDWVRGGGALLLIADHAPYGSAAESLARRFGVEMSKTSTSDEANSLSSSRNPGFIVYSRDSGRLADHAITRGRDAGERISTAMTFTGQSLKGPEGSVAFLKLADSARDRVAGSSTDYTSAAGRSQGLALAFGLGRVVVLGEAAMMSAQLIGPDRRPFGMNQPGIDNRQLALNIAHWLSGLLK